jgi:hypothetical protein
MPNETEMTWSVCKSKEPISRNLPLLHLKIIYKMVRFHWICDGGQNSFVPPGGVNIDEQNGVTHVNCEMEVSILALELVQVHI